MVLNKEVRNRASLNFDVEKQGRVHVHLQNLAKKCAYCIHSLVDTTS